MAKKVNRTLIGAFVLGAIVLVVAGVMVFGSGKFFAKTNTYVMFFEGSVKGLNVGSPVMYRGVKIGEVKNIKLLFNPEKLTTVIPVYVDVDPRNFALAGEETMKTLLEKAGQYVYLQPLIDKGLKAQLQTQSLVTGQLMINVELYPDKPIRLVGIEKKYPEIPTIPTTLEELEKTFENLPLKEITENLNSSLASINSIANSPVCLVGPSGAPGGGILTTTLLLTQPANRKDSNRAVQDRVIAQSSFPAGGENVSDRYHRKNGPGLSIRSAGPNARVSLPVPSSNPPPSGRSEMC